MQTICQRINCTVCYEALWFLAEWIVYVIHYNTKMLYTNCN